MILLDELVLHPRHNMVYAGYFLGMEKGITCWDDKYVRIMICSACSNIKLLTCSFVIMIVVSLSFLNGQGIIKSTWRGLWVEIAHNLVMGIFLSLIFYLFNFTLF